MSGKRAWRKGSRLWLYRSPIGPKLPRVAPVKRKRIRGARLWLYRTPIGPYHDRRLDSRHVYQKPIGPKLPRKGRAIYWRPIGPKVPKGGIPKRVNVAAVAIGPSPRAVIMRVVAEKAAELGFTAADMIGRSRKAPVSQARFLVIREVRERFKLSMPQIGRLFRYRDHTPILHALRRAKEMEASGDLPPAPAIYAEAA